MFFASIVVSVLLAIANLNSPFRERKQNPDHPHPVHTQAVQQDVPVVS